MSRLKYIEKGERDKKADRQTDRRSYCQTGRQRQKQYVNTHTKKEEKYYCMHVWPCSCVVLCMRVTRVLMHMFVHRSVRVPGYRRPVPGVHAGREVAGQPV